MKKGGSFGMNKKNLRRVSYLINSQTDYNINKLSKIENKKPGQIIDELVRDHMLNLKGYKYARTN